MKPILIPYLINFHLLDKGDRIFVIPYEKRELFAHEFLLYKCTIDPDLGFIWTGKFITNSDKNYKGRDEDFWYKKVDNNGRYREGAFGLMELRIEKKKIIHLIKV